MAENLFYEHEETDKIQSCEIMIELQSRQAMKYVRPPINEAICEIHFLLPFPLDQTQIERIQPVWQANYPSQQMVAEQNVQLQLSMDKVDAKSIPVGHKLIARSADGKNLAQLGGTLVAINRLNPYLGWEESFRDTILARVADAVNLYGIQDLDRVGLRYINKIDLPEKPVKWSDWFAVSLPVPEDFGERGGMFQFHFEQPMGGELHALINFLSLPTTLEKTTSVILDIDLVWHGFGKVSELATTLEAVHAPHHNLFEAYLLDKARNLFQIKH
jgi:uncharacterized protein (TIGR04255 family)